MKRLALSAALVGASALAHPAQAQQLSPVPVVETGHSVLTVSGEGESNSAPDVAVFTAGVQTQAPTAADALADNSRKMTQVIAALKKANIADRDIQTNNLSISPVYADPERDAAMAARSGQPYVPPPNSERLRRIIGYEVSNNVMVRQRDLKNFGKVIDTLVAAGANQVNGPNFQLEKQEEALNKARVSAVRDARERAELYAGAAGLRIVRVLSIAEGGSNYRPQPMFRSMAMDAAASPPPAPIQPGEVELNATVTVLYELAP